MNPNQIADLGAITLIKHPLFQRRLAAMARCAELQRDLAYLRGRDEAK